jgi:hypothetical protein
VGEPEGAGYVAGGALVLWVGVGVQKDDGEGPVAFCVEFLGLFRLLRGLLMLSEIVTRRQVLRDTNLAS